MRAAAGGGVRAAGAAAVAHGADRRRRPVRREVPAAGRQQHAAGRIDRAAGGGAGAADRLCRAGAPRRADALGPPGGGSGLRTARFGDRGRGVDPRHQVGSCAGPGAAQQLRLGRGAAVHRQHRGAGLRVSGALPHRGDAGGRRRPGQDHAQHGPGRAQPGPHTGADDVAGSPAAVARQRADRRPAGVHRRDEGVARHAGDAAVQLRHPGDPGLHAGCGRTPGRGVDRRAGHRRGGSAADGRDLPADRTRRIDQRQLIVAISVWQAAAFGPLTARC